MDESLPVLKPREAVKVLVRIGFVKKRQTGSHLIMAKNGKIIPVPIHSKDLKKGVTRSIIKQSGLSIKGFLKLL